MASNEDEETGTNKSGAQALLDREVARLTAALENANRRYVTPQPLPVIFTEPPMFTERDGITELNGRVLCDDGSVYAVVAWYHHDERQDRARLKGPGVALLSESFDE